MLAAMVPVLLALPIVGAAAARSSPANPVGWMLLASGVALPLALGAYLYATASYAGGVNLPGAGLAGWLDGWPWVPALPVLPTVGLLLFPDGKLPSPWWRPVLWADCLLLAALTVSVLFAPHLLDFPDVSNPTALPGDAGRFAEGLLVLVVFVAPLSTLSAFSLHQRRRRTSDALQAEALDLVLPAAWLVAAAWWGCIVLTSLGGPSISALPLEAGSMLVFAITAWIAIRRYGLFDARLALSRGLVYGGLSACVIGVYLALVAGLGRLAADAVSGPVAVVLAALSDCS